MNQLFTDLPVMHAPPRPTMPPRPRPSRAKIRFAMPTFGAVVTDPDEHRAQLARKMRKCMSGLSKTCPGHFLSSHSGHRICDDCKQSEVFHGYSEFSACGF